MLKFSPKCMHLLMIPRHQFSFRQFLFCLHLRDPVRLHNRGTPMQFCEISHSQDSWALPYGWQGNTEVWNEQGWEGVWALQGCTGKNQGSAKYSPQAKYSWPVCFCKHPLGDRSTIHLLMYCLWLPLHYNGRVVRLQQRMPSPSIYSLAFYRKNVLIPG